MQWYMAELYVKASWGIANRFRTYRASYDLARALKRRLVIVDGEKDGGFDADLGDIVEIKDIRVIPLGEYQKMIDLHHLNPTDACSIVKPLRHFESLAGYQKIVINACDLLVDGLTGTNDFYKHIKPSKKALDSMGRILQVIRQKKAVGVHVRQGSISDYYNGYFFAKWDNSADEPPYMCCYNNTSLNTSSCLDNVVGYEKYREMMDKEPKDTMFFIATDRPACLLQFKVHFPRRILHNPLQTDPDVSTFTGFLDFWCLAHCSKLIISQISSFSGEAIRVNGTPYESP